MGMPVIVDVDAPEKVFKKVFDYFRYVDEKFSPYKQNSEVTKINDKRIGKNLSSDMKLILKLSKETKEATVGYFDIYRNGFMDPSGIVKGWAINKAAEILKNFKYKDFYVEASGDIQTHGLNNEKKKWAVGIRNPFKKNEIVKVVYLSGEGIATSGSYEKGEHIYNPNGKIDNEIVSLTVIGPNVYEADRFATPAFAMGRDGIKFVERQKGLVGFMIDINGIATMTNSFEKYLNA